MNIKFFGKFPTIRLDYLLTNFVITPNLVFSTGITICFHANELTPIYVLRWSMVGPVSVPPTAPDSSPSSRGSQALLKMEEASPFSLLYWAPKQCNLLCATAVSWVECCHLCWICCRSCNTTIAEVRMADQNERAFQKQPTINLNRKGGLKPSESRWAVSTLFNEVRFEYWEYFIWVFKIKIPGSCATLG